MGRRPLQDQEGMLSVKQLSCWYWEMLFFMAEQVFLLMGEVGTDA